MEEQQNNNLSAEILNGNTESLTGLVGSAQDLKEPGVYPVVAKPLHILAAIFAQMISLPIFRVNSFLPLSFFRHCWCPECLKNNIDVSKTTVLATLCFFSQSVWILGC